MIADLKKQFMACVSDLSALEGWRTHEAMTHFLACAYHAIKKATVLGADADACEAAYMHQVRRCQKPQRTMGTTATMLGIVTHALQERTADFIGPVFMETSASERMGQFFTPHDVCVMMAEITLQEVPVQLERLSHITIDEPACGAGAMILACCDYLRRQGVNYQERVGFRLTDLDQEAYQAAYIQCSLAGVAATVYHANTLTLEVRGQACTPMMRMRPWLARPGWVLKAKEVEPAGSAEAPAVRGSHAAGQLALFDIDAYSQEVA